jgi:hypothetical protein
MTFSVQRRGRLRIAAGALWRGARTFFATARRAGKRRSRSALVWTTLFLALLHMGLLYLFATRPALRDPLYHERIDLLQQHIAAAPQNKPTVVVMIGTSRTGNAFNARLMQDKLTADLHRPVVAFNLGIAGCGPVMQQVYVRRLLQQGIKPDLILLEVVPFFFLDNGDEPIEYGQLDLTRVSSDEIDAFANYGVALDDYRKRWNEIRLNPWGEMRFQLLRRVRPTWLPPNLALNWNSKIDRWGWRSVDIDPMPEEVYRPSLERAFSEHGRFFPNFRFGSPAVRAFNDTLALCRAENIPVMVVHLPEDSNFRAWYPPQTKQLINETFLRMASAHGAAWIDATDWVPDGHFFDGHHILKRGASLFTERLADECPARLRELAKPLGKARGE